MIKFKGIDPILYVKTLEKIIDLFILVRDNENYLIFDQMLYCFLKVYKSYYSEVQEQGSISKKSIIPDKFNSYPNLTQKLIDSSLRLINFFENIQNIQLNETLVEYYTCIITENSILKFLNPADYFKYNYRLSLFYHTKISDKTIVYLDNALKSLDFTTDITILQNLTNFSVIASDYFLAANNDRISINYLEISRNIDKMILDLVRPKNSNLLENLSEKHKKISKFYLLKGLDEGKEELLRLIELLSDTKNPNLIEKLKWAYLELINVSPSNESKKDIYLKLVKIESNHENLAKYYEQLGKLEKITNEKVSFYNSSIDYYDKMNNYEKVSEIFQICAKLLKKDAPRESIKYFDNSISTEIKIGIKPITELVNLYHQIKEISKEKGFWAELRNCLLSLIKLYEKTDYNQYKFKIFKHYKEIIDLMINSNSEKVKYLERNIEVAKSLNDKIYIAEAYKEIALLCHDSKSYKKAGAAYFELGPSYYKQAYKFYRGSAELYNGKKKYNKSCDCYEKVIEIYIKINGREATKKLIEYFEIISEHTEIEHFETLFINSLLSENSDPATKSSIYSIFSDILKKNPIKRYDLIENYLMLSIDEQLKFREPKELIDVCEKLNIEFKSLNIETSLNFKHRAISLLEDNDKSNILKLSKMYQELGIGYKEQSKFEDSIECFEKSSKYAKSSENPKSNKIRVINCLNIAEIKEYKKEISVAQYHRLEALRINDEKSVGDDKIIKKNIDLMEKNQRTIGNNYISDEFFELKSRFFNKRNAKRLSQTATPKLREKKLNGTFI